MSWLSLRSKVFFVAFIAIMIVGLGSALAFGNAWLKITRAYGFSRLNNYLTSLIKTEINKSIVADVLDEKEWSFQAFPEKNSTTAESSFKIHWYKMPQGNENEWIEKNVTNHLFGTQLEAGSFLIKPDISHIREHYVTFRKLKDHILVIGSDDHRNFLELSQWATPFLSVIIGAILLTLFFAALLSKKITEDYATLAGAMENIGTGRLKNLRLPTSQDPEIRRLVNSMSRMTKLLEIKNEKIAEVSRVADQDPMTGLPNYRAFAQHVDAMMQSQIKKGTVLVLCIFDIDFFKRVNDKYGHQVGDHVLRFVATLVVKHLRLGKTPERRKDFFGRYGGEEFVGVFADVKTDSLHIAPLRVLRALKGATIEIPAKLAADGKPFALKISMSVGMAAWYPGRHANLEQWVGEADQALYTAKKNGRARLIQIVPDLKTWT